MTGTKKIIIVKYIFSIKRLIEKMPNRRKSRTGLSHFNMQWKRWDGTLLLFLLFFIQFNLGGADNASFKKKNN
jgi:hypothetical protein